MVIEYLLNVQVRISGSELIKLCCDGINSIKHYSGSFL